MNGNNIISGTLLNRETSSKVGNFELAKAYLASGKGPVLERNYPFKEDTSTPVSYSSLNQPVEELVTDIRVFPSIFKEYSGNTITYSQAKNTGGYTSLTEQDVEVIRNEIKSHIYTYGAVTSMLYQASTAEKSVYRGPGAENLNANHAVTIVGWDNNYTAEGWPKPGAYICQNSYGEAAFDRGYVYVSYEDKFIEQNLTGARAAEEYDIDNIYEHDEWGSLNLIASSGLVNDQYRQYDNKEITAINVFDRSTTREETVKKVGFTNWSNQKVEIYITEKFSDKGLPYNFTKVKNLTQTLEPGYYMLDLDTSLKLSSTKYAVAVRFIQDNQEKIATAAVETIITDPNSWWYGIKGEKGETYFVDLFNPASAENLYWTINVPDSNGQYANAAIKVYTNNPEEPTPPVLVDPEDLLVSDTFSVNGKYRRITMVEKETSINDFINKISINSKYPDYASSEITIVDKDKNKVTSGIIKTGYMVLVAESEYQIAVRGDLNCDGKRDVLDLTRIRNHIVGKTSGVLTGIAYYAADVNNTSVVDVLDLSIMRKLMVE